MIKEALQCLLLHKVVPYEDMNQALDITAFPKNGFNSEAHNYLHAELQTADAPTLHLYH